MDNKRPHSSFPSLHVKFWVNFELAVIPHIRCSKLQQTALLSIHASIVALPRSTLGNIHAHIIGLKNVFEKQQRNTSLHPVFFSWLLLKLKARKLIEEHTNYRYYIDIMACTTLN